MLRVKSLIGLQVHGEFGFPVDGLGDTDSADVQFGDGKWLLRSFEGQTVLNLPPPPPEAPKASGLSWRILGHNDEATLLRLNPPNFQAPALRQPNQARPVLLYRKATARWERLDAPGPEPALRLIGPWLLMTAGEEKRGRSSPGAAQRRGSPAERYSMEKLHRPVVSHRFETALNYYPGLLIAMDTRNGRTWLRWTPKVGQNPTLRLADAAAG